MCYKLFRNKISLINHKILINTIEKATDQQRRFNTMLLCHFLYQTATISHRKEQHSKKYIIILHHFYHLVWIAYSCC